MKLNEIQDLIKFVSKSGVCEVELETKDVKIIIKTTSGKKDQVVIQSPAQPFYQNVSPSALAAAPETKIPEAKAAPANEEAKYITVKSPMIGTFYRAAAADKPPFVNVGDEIQIGKPVCIIEAMKLFNEIESDIKGKIVKVLVNDASPVEYDQPLFLVDPS
ncbi:MAG: acetyl-CoA carboxylase biotin carboxyl carrier protein [Bacteroidia bacterium]